MGSVTDIAWECPACGTKNIAQAYEDLTDDFEQEPLPRKAVPSNAELKWNPPCTECGKYRLVEPPVVLVEFPMEREWMKRIKPENRALRWSEKQEKYWDGKFELYVSLPTLLNWTDRDWINFIDAHGKWL